MQDNQLKLERVENKPNEKTTGGGRPDRENPTIGGMRASIGLVMTMMKLFIGLRQILSYSTMCMILRFLAIG